LKKNIGSVEEIVSSNTPFGIPTNPKTSKKNQFKVFTKKSKDYDILLYHIEKNKRRIEFISLKDITKNVDDISKPKVFIPDGYGAGESFPHQILGQPEFAEKNSVCSQSYLYTAFKRDIEAKNFIIYLKTKFFRALVLSLKITQSAPNKVYRFVPIQDFTTQSDINWSLSIPEIDQQLYKKYQLSEEEVAFIESMIKPMA
jgi:hypothetical protein